jgi:hypothetical protein
MREETGMEKEKVETTDMEELHARLYETVTNTIERIKKGTMQLQPEACKDCPNLDKCDLPYVDALRMAFSEADMPCGISCQDLGGRRIVQMTYEGEVFMQVDPITKEALQKCTDDMCNTVFYHRVFGVEE